MPVLRCEACAAKLSWTGRGRPARHCSNACRQKAFRQRAKNKENELAGAVDLHSPIPESLDSFIGREAELAELRNAVRTRRLVTLVGPAGVGKTRLALELARRTSGARQRRIRLVELARVTDGARVVDAIAKAVGTEAGDLQSVVELVNRDRLALLIDNCEQVVESCAEVVYELLARCPQLSVLATSREPLPLADSHVVRVEPFPVGGLAHGAAREQLVASSAVQLFLDRARSADPEFRMAEDDIEAVGRLCGRLDGLPFAIELAARRVYSMSVRELLHCMDDQLALLTESARATTPQHRTLRATIDWSYRLLSPVEQQVLRRLAMFPNGLTVATAARVCAVPGIAEVLPALASKSLAHRSGDRFRLLESVRLYGVEQLRLAGEQHAMTLRAARWLADLASPLSDSVSPVANQVFDLDCGNLRTVVDLLELHPDEAETRVLLAAVLIRVLHSRGRFAQARDLADTMLVRHGQTRNAPLVMLAASWLALSRGDVARGMDHAVDAVSSVEAQDRPALLVRALTHLGWALSEAGRTVTSECVRRRVVAMCERIGEADALAQAQWNLAWLLVREGELDESRTLLEQALRVARKSSRPDELGPVLYTAGALELLGGDLQQATKYFAEVLDASPRDTFSRSHALEGLAMVAERQGDHTRSARLFAAAAVSRHRYDAGSTPGWGRWVGEPVVRQGMPPEVPSVGTVPNHAPGVVEMTDDPLSTLLIGLERRVMTMVVEGESNDQIARKLGISASTVRNHVDAVMAKLRMDNRAQLIRWHVGRRTPGSVSPRARGAR